MGLGHLCGGSGNEGLCSRVDTSSQTVGGPELSEGQPEPPAAQPAPRPPPPSPAAPGKCWAFAPRSQYAQPKAGNSKARNRPLPNGSDRGPGLPTAALQMCPLPGGWRGRRAKVIAWTQREGDLLCVTAADSDRDCAPASSA